MNAFHVIALYVLCGFSIYLAVETHKENKKLSASIISAQTDIIGLKTNSSNNDFFFRALSRIPEEQATLKIGNSKYTSVYGPAGPLLVSLQDVQKHAGGYKLFLHIGNPSLAKISNPVINISYGKDWMKSRATFSPMKDMLPGTWNKVAVVLAPAAEEELRFMSLTIDANIVSLIHDADKY